MFGRADVLLATDDGLGLLLAEDNPPGLDVAGIFDNWLDLLSADSFVFDSVGSTAVCVRGGEFLFVKSGCCATLASTELSTLLILLVLLFADESVVLAVDAAVFAWLDLFADVDFECRDELVDSASRNSHDSWNSSINNNKFY